MEIQQKLHFRDVKSEVSLNENDCAIEQSEANIGLSPVQLKELVVGSNVQLKLPFQLI